MQEDHAARVWDDAHLGISPPPPRDVSLQGRLDPALLPPTVVRKLAGSGTGVWKDAAPPPTSHLQGQGRAIHMLGCRFPKDTFQGLRPVEGAVRGQHVAGGWARL